MDTPNVPEELKIYNLVNEYMFLQLLCVSLPSAEDRSELEEAAQIFSEGLPLRILADIQLANAIKNTNLKESVFSSRQHLLDAIQDLNYALEKSREFVTYH